MKFIHYYTIFFLIILQGIIGWYMVKSGLVNDVTVSHYRLSLHLTGAILIFHLYFLELKNLKQILKIKIFFFLKRNFHLFFYFINFFQIIIGAFVSGLDAGKIYQTWPLMNDNYFPNDINFKNF